MPSESFHPAASVAEKALDTIIRLSEAEDNGLIDYALGAPAADTTQDRSYARFFTPDLLKAWANAAAQSSDAIDSNPISCAQDFLDAPYLYRTLAASADEVTIIHHWPDQPAGTHDPIYRMVERGQGWRLAGVDCGGAMRFGMP